MLLVTHFLHFGTTPHLAGASVGRKEAKKSLHTVPKHHGFRCIMSSPKKYRSVES